MLAGDIVENIKTLSLKSEQVKASIYSSVNKNYVDLLSSNASQWDFKSVKALQAEITRLGNTFEKVTKPKIQSAISQHKDLEKQFDEVKNIAGMLELLLAFHNEIMFSKSCPSSKFGEKANYLKQAKTILDNLFPKRSYCDVSIYKILCKQLVNVKTQFTVNVEGRWRSLMIWKIPTSASWNSADSHLNTSLKISPLPEDVTIADIVLGMDTLNLLKSKLNDISQKVFSYFIKPFAKFPVLVPTIKKDEDGRDTLRITKSKSSEHNSIQRLANHMAVFQKISTVISFIHALFHNINSEEIDVDPMNAIGNFIWKDMSDLLIDNLSGDVVRATSRIEQQNEAIYRETVKFECKLVEMGFIPEGTNKLSKYVSDINIHFNNKFCHDILSCAHEIMLNDINNLIEVNPSVDRASIAWDGDEQNEFITLAQNVFFGAEIDEELLNNMFSFPVCHISDSIQKLMDYIYKNLIKAVGTPLHIAVQMYHSCRDIFELYLNVVPMYHKEALKVPQFAAIYYNNCMFLSHHCTTLGHQFRSNLPAGLTGPVFTFADYVALLRKSGRDNFMGQLQLQQKELISMVETCQNFSDCVSQGRLKIIEKAINQILHHFSHLLAVWNNVLPKNITTISIAVLFNTVLEDIINSIFKKEFLSAEEALQLHRMLRVLVIRAPNIFNDFLPTDIDETASIYDHIPSWKKFRCMVKILNANLLEIATLWNEGEAASSMSEGDVRSLIRTLFQNTDERSQVLAKIKRKSDHS